MFKGIFANIVTGIIMMLLGLVIGASSILGIFNKKLKAVHDVVIATQLIVAPVVTTVDAHEKRIDKNEDNNRRTNERLNTLASHTHKE